MNSCIAWRLCGAAFLLCACAGRAACAEESVAEILANVRAAVEKGDRKQAIQLATKAIAADPKYIPAYMTRAALLQAQGEHARALHDFDKMIELGPGDASTYYQRGRCRFCVGKLPESVEDFDKFVAMRPDLKSQQWERGIALYYAGRFDDGAAQFALYQTYHDNDVENATWRYLCMARSEGTEKARAELLRIKDDRRVPMMQIYAMFRGEMKAEEVLEAAQAGEPSPEQLNQNLFYAHLYLGLFNEAAGDAELAKKHVLEAEKHKIGHYMWNVANIHANQFRNKK